MAIAASRLFVGLLFGVSPLNASTFALVVLLFVVVTLGACLVPSRQRAPRMSPTRALRYQ